MKRLLTDFGWCEVVNKKFFDDNVEFEWIGTIEEGFIEYDVFKMQDGKKVIRRIEKMRKCYAGYCDYGIAYIHHHGCIVVFNTKEEREKWLDENAYKNGNIVACKMTRKECETMGARSEIYEVGNCGILEPTGKNIRGGQIFQW